MKNLARTAGIGVLMLGLSFSSLACNRSDKQEVNSSAKVDSLEQELDTYKWQSDLKDTLLENREVQIGNLISLSFYKFEDSSKFAMANYDICDDYPEKLIAMDYMVSCYKDGVFLLDVLELRGNEQLSSATEQIMSEIEMYMERFKAEYPAGSNEIKSSLDEKV